MIPRILIAGQASGVGKTTVTLGLIAALRARGLVVQPFKCGPDYIDPTYHTLAAGRPCRNLDTWMLTAEQMVDSFHRACTGADIAVIEGVMGLYDGSSYTEETGSAAQIAKLLDAPVLLVLDIGKLARSAGALALGYKAFDPDLHLAGFILNRAGSESHARGCADAIRQATGLPVMGWLPKGGTLHIPERHLGLIPTGERQALDQLIEATRDAVAGAFELSEITRLAGEGSANGQSTMAERMQPPFSSPDAERHSPVLAVARDEAFSFYYPDNLEMLAAAGAQIHFFSPLRGETLPATTAGIYLGGGFPELYAEQLSASQALWTQLRQVHEAGVPIYAECGGFMALTEALVDPEQRRWPMAGLVPGETHMQARLVDLGYRLATACTNNLLARAGETVRGHEFHYSKWLVDPSHLQGNTAWLLRRRQGEEARPGGYVRGNLLASYLHIHFGQNPSLAQRFVAYMHRVND